MIHARDDYDRIQDPAGLIGEDEPVFLMRAQDMNAPDTVRDWAARAARNGADPVIVDAALCQATRMEEWQSAHGKKVPDLMKP